MGSGNNLQEQIGFSHVGTNYDLPCRLCNLQKQTTQSLGTDFNLQEQEQITILITICGSRFESDGTEYENIWHVPWPVPDFTTGPGPEI